MKQVILDKIRRKKPFKYSYSDNAPLYMGMLPLRDENTVIPKFIPKEILLITKNGLVIEQRKGVIYGICQQIENEMNSYDQNDYLFFKDGQPVYSGQWDGQYITPFPAPEPDTIKLTAIALYSKVVTYPKTVTRMIVRKLKGGEKDTMAKSIFMWMMALLIILIAVIFMIAVTAMGSGEEELLPADGVTNPGIETTTTTTTTTHPKADLTIPAPEEPGVNRATQGGNTPAIAVPIE